MSSSSIGNQFEELIRIVERLRGPDGCPWDKEQTSSSLISYLLEETYEVIEAIDEKNWDGLKEEIGDLMLHMVFQATIAKEDELFDISESLKNINEKLIRRHPHVFNKKNLVKDSIKPNWELEKHKEKKRNSRLDGVPQNLPGLIRAQRIQEKASYVGFDFQKEEEIWNKILEELEELKDAQQNNNKDEILEEIGDAIFSLTNLARFLGVSADDALRKSNNKFISRFKKIENELKGKGKKIEESSLNEMDQIWNAIKKKE
ncbi:MAG: nucleoside triphosphate pyrophosphohydrolase [Candidatus Marinimicrobia bacterium]|jgi:MazG family protein|nr:nucleoside triphosphate pyrophosphohydrolase [Candidatus Neomarinimicrobiota bacterium]|tara:strand:+ start:3363 stop:4142 length:780 start_codon:yes stop_codon:yes gene_type:complete